MDHTAEKQILFTDSTTFHYSNLIECNDIFQRLELPTQVKDGAIPTFVKYKTFPSDYAKAVDYDLLSIADYTF